MTELTDRAGQWLEARVAGIPAPVASRLAEPYWEGCRQGELRFQRCAACGEIPPMPAPLCPRCRSRTVPWVGSSGLGTVYSWTVVWRPQHPAFEVPYAPVVVRLQEGAHLMSALTGLRVGDVRVGLPVEVEFRALEPPSSPPSVLPFFRPREEGRD